MKKHQQFLIHETMLLVCRVRHGEPEEQQKNMLQVYHSKGRTAQQHIQPILAVFKDLYKRRHVLRFEGRMGDES